MAKSQIEYGQIKILAFKLSRRISMKLKTLWKLAPEGFICNSIPDGTFTKTSLLVALRNVLGDVSKDTIDKAKPKEKENILFLANQTLDNYFNFLGSGWIKLVPITWNVDLRTKQTWPQHVFYLKLRAKTPKGADIKSPWELSRSHFLLWLGEAYLLTKNERYADKVVELLNSWIDNNPLMYTVNWTCSMDVAIRAVNWMYALTMISQSEAFSESFAKKICLSLFQHGFFIRHNLEKSEPWSNNHYTADLVGLLYIGTLFQHTSKGRKWCKYAIKEFYDQTRKQMLPSGVHYEKSISYHRLMVELTSYPLSMLIRTGESIPDDIVNLAQKMYDYVGTYLKPNGNAPLLADNDDGRFLPFTYSEFRNHGYLLDAQGIDHRIVNISIPPLFRLCHNGQSQVYPDAEIAIIKEFDTYLLINNSGYSRCLEENNKMRIGTHTHNDQLSFDFSIGDVDIFIDSGSYIYTSSIKNRNEFRSTRKHNTVIVDDEEQNLLSGTNAFLIEKNNTNRALKVDGSRCIGSYETIKGKLKHEREFEISERLLMITDSLRKNGQRHKGEIFFHLSDDVIPSLENDKTVGLKCSQYAVKITVEGVGNTGQIETKVLDDTWSPSYGVRRHTKVINCVFTFDDECFITTKIEWLKR